MYIHITILKKELLSSFFLKGLLISILCFLNFGCSAQLTGSIIVGSKQPAPFNTLNAAFEVLKLQGIEGDICFILEDDEYKVNQIELSGISGISRSTVIKIRPTNEANPVIELVSGSELLSISSIGRVLIDGRCNEQDTLHRISLKAENPIIIHTIETKQKEDRLSFSIINCNLVDNGIEGVGISHYDDRNIKTGTFLSSDSILSINNNYYNFSKSIFTATPNTICFRNNFYSSNISGVFIQAFTPKTRGEINIRANCFYNCTEPISIYANQSDVNIDCNKIICNSYSDVGVVVIGAYNLDVKNNSILGIISIGLEYYSSKKVNIRYNTIKIKPDRPIFVSFAYYASCIYTNITLCPVQKFQNNIFELDDSNVKDISRAFVFIDESAYVSGHESRQTNESGNCFFHVSPLSHFGYCDLESYPTYNDWIKNSNQTTSSSIDKQNIFLSYTDLHLTVPNHQGIPIPEITTDIDCNPRDPLHPDAGAYEYKGNTEVQPDFTFQNTCQPTAFTFANASSFTSPIWDFGDGQTSTLASPSHSYTATGTYTVSLTATNSSGLTQKVSKTVSVYARPTAPVIKISGGR